MSKATKPLRIVFLVGSDSLSTRRTIESVCNLPCVEAVAILLDTAKPSFSARMRSLRRNMRREGPRYAAYRLLDGLSAFMDARANSFAPRGEVEALLRNAFPERCFTLADISARFRCPLIDVGNLNSPKSAAALRDCSADLGLVIGTRILRRSTFSIPSLGCLNLHKGKVPEFRGMPPAFWELYEGAERAGVTVHFVDDGLDTGDIVGSSEIPIHPNETEASLRTKLDWEGARLLAECVAELHAGTAQRTSQPKSSTRPRTRPTRLERNQLAKRRPGTLSQAKPFKNIFKTSFYLGLYYSGIYALIRFVHRRKGHCRAAILLYHRVNDFSVDPLTTSTKRFAEHLVLLGRRHCVCDSESLVEQLNRREGIPPDLVMIHFDDCYRDVFSNAAPLLKSARMPAIAFISSGFIGTTRAFKHDEERYPFTFENLDAQEICALPGSGIGIGAHTVNHVDLGTVALPEANQEVFDCLRDLESLTGSPVKLFSFPFGQKSNIREDVREIIRKAGFSSTFLRSWRVRSRQYR